MRNYKPFITLLIAGLFTFQVFGQKSIEWGEEVRITNKITSMYHIDGNTYIMTVNSETGEPATFYKFNSDLKKENSIDFTQNRIVDSKDYDLLGSMRLNGEIYILATTYEKKVKRLYYGKIDLESFKLKPFRMLLHSSKIENLQDKRAVIKKELLDFDADNSINIRYAPDGKSVLLMQKMEKRTKYARVLGILIDENLDVLYSKVFEFDSDKDDFDLKRIVLDSDRTAYILYNPDLESTTSTDHNIHLGSINSKGELSDKGIVNLEVEDVMSLSLDLDHRSNTLLVSGSGGDDDEYGLFVSLYAIDDNMKNYYSEYFPMFEKDNKRDDISLLFIDDIYTFENGAMALVVDHLRLEKGYDDEYSKDSQDLIYFVIDDRGQKMKEETIDVEDADGVGYYRDWMSGNSLYIALMDRDYMLYEINDVGEKVKTELEVEDDDVHPYWSKSSFGAGRTLYFIGLEEQDEDYYSTFESYLGVLSY